MFLNWGIESIKWKFGLADNHKISFKESFVQILQSTTTSLITPNRTGEFIGKTLFSKSKNKKEVIAISILCSISQLTATLSIGLIGFSYWLYQEQHSSILALGAFAGALLITIIYFSIHRYTNFSWFPIKHAASILNFRKQTFLLLLSSLRYLVFSFQFLLALNFFGHISIDHVYLITVYYLLNTCIPSAAFAELGVREVVSLSIFGGIVGTEAAIASAFLIWCINLLLPAISGSIIIGYRNLKASNFKIIRRAFRVYSI